MNHLSFKLNNSLKGHIEPLFGCFFNYFNNIYDYGMAG